MAILEEPIKKVKVIKNYIVGIRNSFYFQGKKCTCN